MFILCGFTLLKQSKVYGVEKVYIVSPFTYPKLIFKTQILFYNVLESEYDVS